METLKQILTVVLVSCAMQLFAQVEVTFSDMVGNGLVAEKVEININGKTAQLSVDQNFPMDEVAFTLPQAGVYVVRLQCVCKLSNDYYTRQGSGVMKVLVRGGERFSIIGNYALNPVELTVQQMQFAPENSSSQYGGQNYNSYQNNSSGSSVCRACNGTGISRYSYISTPTYGGTPIYEWCDVCKSKVRSHTHNVCPVCGGAGSK